MTDARPRPSLRALDNWPRPWPLVAFVWAIVGFLGQGLGSSYDLYRRRPR